jgi:hypothetical protein
MKLTQQALQKIKDRKLRLRLCAILNVTDQTIGDYIRKNKPNGPLTTYSALNVISEATGFSYDVILEKAGEEATGYK